ncbi:MAG: VWA domain-containing protein, partial [Chloroflexi bacterium]|nr:VWA domain-containing protein [Chloroflexota bacterium]
NLPGSACPDWNSGGDPRGCTRTNTAAGLMLAGMELTSVRARPEAVKVVVLLSDGQANAAYVNNPPFNAYTPTPDDWYCPPGFWSKVLDGQVTGERVADDHHGPWCTDGDPESGYVNPALGASSIDDAEDATRSFADWVGCLPPGENSICAADGIGAVIFTVGLGNGLIDPGFGPVLGAGGELLRYVARVGFDGDPRRTSADPCDSAGLTTNCGNYYFAPSTAQLGGIFKDIADRVFTRLTH